tara:strand:- start:3448 stop:3597 length:150 start_codon:yes stop_codon:yes gene_type:complete
MEPTLIVGLVLFLASEVLPFTPLKGNGLLDSIIKALRIAFPHPSDTGKK